MEVLRNRRAGSMKRREFIALIGGAAASVVPRSVRAQQGVPVVGYVRSTTAAGFAHLEASLRQGLKEAGFVEGQNVAIEYRYADNRPDQLPALITDLIQRRVTVIAGNQIAALAAKAATTTVPIVFASGTDPVQNGLVASLNRPGANITGAVFFGPDLGAKRLEFLRQFVPKAATIAVLMHANSPPADAERSEVLAAAKARGLRLLFFEVGNEREIDAAFASLVQRETGALLVGSTAFINSHREQVAGLAARHKLPAIYAWSDAAHAGGLMSYGASQRDAYRQAGTYVGRILMGEKPSDLPVTRSTKFEFVINLKVAKALGLDIPPMLLALADEVIE
jgi:putative ABC transport system substrate-binding protein